MAKSHVPYSKTHIGYSPRYRAFSVFVCLFVSFLAVPPQPVLRRPDRIPSLISWGSKLVFDHRENNRVPFPVPGAQVACETAPKDKEYSVR